jgi:hypothetical protein
VHEGFVSFAHGAVAGFPHLGLDVEEGVGGIVKLGFATRAVDEDEDSGDFTPVGLDDVDGFLDAATTGDDVFGDDVALARDDLEATHDEGAFGVLFSEDALGVEGFGDFVANEDASEGGGDDAIDGTDVGGGFHAANEFSAEGLCVAGPAEDFGALEVAVGVELGAEFKVAFEEGLGFFEDFEDVIVGHGCVTFL